jgi:hemolysin III
MGRFIIRLMRCDHEESRSEEIVNAATHALGVVLSAAGLITLLALAARDGDPWRIVTFAIYGASLVLLYLASTCYHACPAGRAKDVFRLLDHSAIYMLIAGTYTPFMLVSLGGGIWGWSICATVWALAIIGTVIKSTRSARSTWLSTLLYVAMGWIGLIAIGPIINALSAGCLFWILAGGIAYTSGVIFYVWERLPFNHAIWHLFVIKGSVCHFIAVLLYVAPLA